MNEAEKINTSLASLALLSLRAQSGHDYLDYLYGFTLAALRELEGEAIDASAVQVAVENEFGLKIPTATFAIYLKRLVKQGLLTHNEKAHYYDINKLPDSDSLQERDNARKEITSVIEELARFAYTRFDLTWDDYKSSEALTQFLRGYSIDFLRFAEEKSPLPSGINKEKNFSYVIASFITHSEKHQPIIFEGVKKLVQSHILSNALMCPDFKDSGRGFRGVTFFLDTRFTIKLLDLESETATENARSLVLAIQKLKGTVCIFPETKDELRSVIFSVIKGMKNGEARGPIYHEFVRRNRPVTDLILEEQNIDKSLDSFSISNFSSPNYSEDQYRFQIDESDLQREIDSEIEHISDKAKSHDIKVVRNIFALRRGRHFSSIDQVSHIFLTTNSALSRAAFHYEKKESDKKWIFSAVITDYHLAHLAWLKSPMDVPDLPRTEILASCYGAMLPNEKMWNRYLTEVDRLKERNEIDETSHEVLRFSVSAAEEMMAVTQGDIDGLSPHNIRVILKRLEKGYAVDKEKELSEIRGKYSEAEANMKRLHNDIETKSRELERAQNETQNLNKTIFSQQDRIQELETREKSRADAKNARIDRLERVVKIFSSWLFYFLAVVCTLLIVLSIIGKWGDIATAFLAFLSIINLIFGWSAKGARSWVSDKLMDIIRYLLA